MREQKTPTQARIMLAFVFVAAMGFAGKPYMMEEAIVLILLVLLLLASFIAAILVLAIVFILFLEGISRAVLWKKRAVVSPANLSDQALHSEKVMSHARS